MTLDLHTQGFLDALARIDERKKREMRFKANTECPNCCEVYKADDFVTCPSCEADPESQEKKKR